MGEPRLSCSPAAKRPARAAGMEGRACSWDRRHSWEKRAPGPSLFLSNGSGFCQWSAPAERPSLCGQRTLVPCLIDGGSCCNRQFHALGFGPLGMSFGKLSGFCKFWKVQLSGASLVCTDRVRTGDKAAPGRAGQALVAQGPAGTARTVSQ